MCVKRPAIYDYIVCLDLGFRLTVILYFNTGLTLLHVIHGGSRISALRALRHSWANSTCNSRFHNGDGNGEIPVLQRGD